MDQPTNGINLEQFFPEFFAVQGLPAEQHIVAANDGVLELGQHSLHFVYAPMVHWPEVMMTYEATEKILFAADGDVYKRQTPRYGSRTIRASVIMMIWIT